MDYSAIETLTAMGPRLTLVLSNGFEERVPVAVERLAKAGLRPHRVVSGFYEGKEHDRSTERVRAAVAQLTLGSSEYREVKPDAVDSELSDLDPRHDTVACDITGFSRSLMLRTLTRVARRGLNMLILYTEAKEYYPLESEFRRFLEIEDPNAAFANLAEYENAELVYSSKCSVEEIDDLSGELFPNHPVLLIAFLAFKRSRLSVILNQYETNARVIIAGVPVRPDLLWRERALEIINFDLLQDNQHNIRKLSTLSWEETSRFISELYDAGKCKYRYNVLLAPLGSKMQTVGAWHFAFHHPEVKVITSTPNRLFPEKYSRGFTESHLIQLPYTAVGT